MSITGANLPCTVALAHRHSRVGETGDAAKPQQRYHARQARRDAREAMRTRTPSEGSAPAVAPRSPVHARALSLSPFGLTRRELEVAQLLRLRRSNSELASTLGISEHTARHHTENVLSKLGVHSRTQVDEYFMRRGVEHVAAPASTRIPRSARTRARRPPP